MRFFIINTDYSAFVQRLVGDNSGYSDLSFDEQHRVRMGTFFGTADFYSSNLQVIGHDAWDVIANIESMQKAWAREHGFRYDRQSWGLRFRKNILPWPYRKSRQNWMYSILAEQIKQFRPDIIYSMAMETIDSNFLRSVSGYYRIAIGQHAATPLYTDIKEYDLVISSLPNQVDYFRAAGMRSEYLRLGFEPRVLSHLNEHTGHKHQIAFIGGVGGIYESGTEALNMLCSALPLSIWSYGKEQLDSESQILKCLRPPIWGIEMFQACLDSKIVFNRHSNLADLHYANNMRLYEATGVGACLLTDAKSNLADLFEPGREVLVYHSPEECVELARYYLEHDAEREAIARAGQARTLRDHTYGQRMQELVEIVERTF